MDPYKYVFDATENGESLLSLCCGVGKELEGLYTNDIVAVDIVPQYLERIPAGSPVLSDALKYTEKQKDNSVDVISIIDGIEHMDKKTGLKLIDEMKRVARREIFLFTPEGPAEDGYLKNEPHNAWGIEGADEHQTHKSGWTQFELEELGFDLLARQSDTSQHGEPYHALMMVWRK